MPTLYRILLGAEPTAFDFRANLAKYLPRRGAELVDLPLWSGVSMFDSVVAAAQTARRYRIGTHLGRLEVPADDRRVLLSHPGSSGQRTVWACEEALLSFFRDVVEITGAR